jgi:hypothetical protein
VVVAGLALVVWMAEQLATIPEVEYLETPTFVKVRQGLYVAPQHVAAIYSDEGVPVLLMVSGQEIRNPGYELAQIVALLV